METIVIKSPQVAISPQKMNLVASLIRKKTLRDSLQKLSFTPKKGGRILYSLLKGTNKTLKEKLDEFFLSKIEVNRGRIQKKMIPRAKGRSDRIRRRYCLINLYISRIVIKK